ncbi:MAG TPA: hypothetical protein DCR43_02745 [Bacteroidales bacterium]|nr:MAG: hypothetical protein A2X11_09080 [Bacteroidetes bacterium GWE2_42_24]OFY26874.1 MAG: hypothetical protein A2X09_11225 [Bacteroidetes bacterium GWF2_43_11]HAQ64762.1 hypothetical protein [Bacteroidales bacterium]HBZ67829.1 hypothetical protein [Bacteroidales bacterium]
MKHFQLFLILTGLVASHSLTAQNRTTGNWADANPQIIQQTLTLPEEGRNGKPLQAGMLEPVSVDLCADALRIEGPVSERVTRWSFAAPGIGGLTVYYDDLTLEPGAELLMTNPSRTIVRGPYTRNDNPQGGAFATGILDDDSLVLELHRPLNDITSTCNISSVSLIKPENAKGFGGAGDCEVNINCSEGTNWQTYKQGIVRILVKSGASSYWCTGTLINNTRNDKTPYVLTANHCGEDASTTDLNQWIFTLNYETTGCPNPLLEPLRTDMTGAESIAHSIETSNKGSDFYLVKLKQTIPVLSNAWFNGWNRENIASTSGVTIHHPQGDIKKISTYTTTLINSNWNGSPMGTHWEVFWVQTTNGFGVTEGGSSGSPLFDADGLVLGSLTGGQSSCTTTGQSDAYGKISYSWNTNINPGSQLAAWLDPDNTGALKLNGLPLATSEIDARVQINIWPNPTRDYCQVYIPAGTNKNAAINVYTTSGSRVQTTNVQEGLNTISLINLSEGIYIILVESESGKSKPERLIVY